MPGFVTRDRARYEAIKASLRARLPLPDGAIESLSKAASTLHQKYAQDFVFIHINKCGGTSMERALGIPLLNHDTALERLAVLGRAQWEARYKFAIVRNPYDRMASMFFYRHTKTGLAPDVLAPRFPEWLEGVGAQLEDGSADKTLRPQAFWVCEAQGRVIVDDLYKLEELSDRLSDLQDRLKREISLPAIKRGSGKIDYRAMFGERQRAIMDRYFARDFDLLGYERM